MAYKFRRGAAKLSGSMSTDDISFSEDSDTQIDFEQDYIAFKTGGSSVLVVSGSDVGIGIPTPHATFHVHADNIHGGVVRISQTDNSGDASQLDLFKARDLLGNGTPTVIGSTDFIGQVRFAAYDGSDYANFADIFVQATAQASPSSHPCKIVFRTTQQESSSPTTAITIDENQNLIAEGNLEAKDQITIRNQNPPASASSNGFRGEIRYDSNYIYVCIADNTWKRVALSTW